MNNNPPNSYAMAEPAAHLQVEKARNERHGHGRGLEATLNKMQNTGQKGGVLVFNVRNAKKTKAELASTGQEGGVLVFNARNAKKTKAELARRLLC